MTRIAFILCVSLATAAACNTACSGSSVSLGEVSASFEGSDTLLIQIEVANEGEDELTVSGVTIEGGGVTGISLADSDQPVPPGTSTVGILATVDTTASGARSITVQFSRAAWNTPGCFTETSAEFQLPSMTSVSTACSEFGLETAAGSCPATALASSDGIETVTLEELAAQEGRSLEELYDLGAPTKISGLWYWENGWDEGRLPADTMLDAAADEYEPRTGDILLFFNNAETTRGQTREFFQGFANHAEIYLGSDLMVGAIEPQVRVGSLDEFYNSVDYELLLVGVVDVDDATANEAAARALTQVGDPFDGTFTKWFFDEDGLASYYCSQLVWWAYQTAAGIDLDSNGGFFIRPDDLMRYPHIRWYVSRGSTAALEDSDVSAGEWDPEADNDGDGQSFLGGDCNDDVDGIYDGAPDVADGWDNDCDGEVDEDESSDYARWFCNVDGTDTDWQHRFYVEGASLAGCWELDGTYIRAVPSGVFDGEWEVVTPSGATYVLFEECTSADASWTIYTSSTGYERLSLDPEQWSCSDWAYLGTNSLWESHGADLLYRHDSDEYTTTMYSAEMAEGEEFGFSYSLAGWSLELW